MTHFARSFALTALMITCSTVYSANAHGRKPLRESGETPLIPSGASTQPSDDPADYSVDSRQTYSVRLSDLKWQVPASHLPGTIHPDRANNNVAIVFHDHRLFMAWRSAPTHFASKKTKLYVVSSVDFGNTWQHELTIALGTDLREPSFQSLGDRLYFKFFQGGTNPFAFEPQGIFVTERFGSQKWSKMSRQSESNEVPWEIKRRNGMYWMSSYSGGHYDVSSPKSNVELHFKKSMNGIDWEDANPKQPVLHAGGASEMGFEFTADGEVWGVTRNEDGDDTGFGSHLVHSKDPLREPWIFPDRSNPSRFDSPRMFRHGNDLYLVARREEGGAYDRGLSFLPLAIRRILFLAKYSALPKRTALYRIDRENRRIVHLMDLPSAGDTAFPSLVRLGADDVLVANYTSPLDMKNASWIQGQVSSRGTQIYFQTIHFSVQTLVH